MKIGVVSDTHRNKETLDAVADWLIEKQHIAMLCHLGDDYEDVIDLADKGIEIVQVPGTYHEGYRSGKLPKKVFENIMGLQIMLVHTEKDITEEDRTIADIILHGHTHNPEISLGDGHVLINPGHLKKSRDKNIDPSFALIDIQDKKIVAKIFDLSYNPIEEIELYRSEYGLYKR